MTGDLKVISTRFRAAIALTALLAARAAPSAPSPPCGADTPPATSSGTYVVLLGTAGGPLIRLKRSEPANLLVVDGCTYLIDAGDRVAVQLAAAGVTPPMLRALFLTHLHFDHTAGLPALMGFRWITRQAAPLDIIGPPGTAALVSGALAFLRVPLPLHGNMLPPGPPLDTSFKSIEVDTHAPATIYTDDHVRVTAVENSHYTSDPLIRERFGDARSYALRFDTRDRAIVFTGDTGPSDAIVALAKGADTLVVETMDLPSTLAMARGRFPNATPEQFGAVATFMEHSHLTPAEIGRMAKAARVRMVVLSHLSPAPDDDLDLSRLASEVKAAGFDGTVVIGQDLLRL